ncbi:hypothetical protein AWN76_008515 [Rhodothermaceae bacterium RA]|nr:hypothetical protein AWN76_008515 [Rhodothermaceae bacterium RA]
MESDFEDRSLRTSPSVTREKWYKHAVRKLAGGYVLIVNAERKNANFFKPGKGFEMCAYNTARELIRSGAVVQTRMHYRGAQYELADLSLLQEGPLPAPARRDEDDEDDPLIEQIGDLEDSSALEPDV